MVEILHKDGFRQHRKIFWRAYGKIDAALANDAGVPARMSRGVIREIAKVSKPRFAKGRGVEIRIATRLGKFASEDRKFSQHDFVLPG
ncbi:MAG: hypothetical protein GC155_01660 [Alphaproteobacteria bacterium]|nr:hypothetical protein [Alphaproteobacteria bacterium]